MKGLFGIVLAFAFANGFSAVLSAEPVRFDREQRIDTTGLASLSGVVLDSIHNEPLAGASVTISGSERHALTDANGRFRIDSISPGLHDIRVSHAFTDSIGIVIAAKTVPFAGGREAKAIFAVPSEHGIKSTLCGQEGPPGNRALLVGEVARVGSNAAASDATVELDWYEVSFRIGKGLTTEPRHLTARVNQAGRYVFCNLNDSLDASIRVVTPRDSSGTITVSLSGSPIGIRYLYLPPAEIARADSTSANRVGGILTGKVIDPAGRPVPQANVDVIGGVYATRSGTDGEFQLSSAPMGTQLLRVRRLGYEVSIQPVVIRSDKSAPIEVAMAKTAPALDPVVIRARLSDAAVRSGFEFRARTGAGRYLSADQIQRHNVQCVFDLLVIPRVNLRPSGGICTRELVVPFRGISSFPSPGPAGLRTEQPGLAGPAAQVGQSRLAACLDIFVDDLPEALTPERGKNTVSFDLAWLNPKSVVGVEIYSPGTAPMRFSHTSHCSLVLIWTSSFHGRRI